MQLMSLPRVFQTVVDQQTFTVQENTFPHIKRFDETLGAGTQWQNDGSGSCSFSMELAFSSYFSAYSQELLCKPVLAFAIIVPSAASENG